MYTINNIYKDYLEQYGEDIDKKLFRDICEEFNISIVNSLLDGAEFNMGNNLSSLSIG